MAVVLTYDDGSPSRFTNLIVVYVVGSTVIILVSIINFEFIYTVCYIKDHIFLFIE